MRMITQYITGIVLMALLPLSGCGGHVSEGGSVSSSAVRLLFEDENGDERRLRLRLR